MVLIFRVESIRETFSGLGGLMKLLRMCRYSCSALGKQPGVLIGCTVDGFSKKSCTNLRLVLVLHTII